MSGPKIELTFDQVTRRFMLSTGLLQPLDLSAEVWAGVIEACSEFDQKVQTENGTTYRIIIQEIATCRVCGCTDDDCRQCIEATGEPCYWVAEDLCSACVGKEEPSE